jgi:hypothetical protein
MNGVALLVAIATVGVDYSWRKTEEGLGEYTIQIEPEIRDLLVAGEEVSSEMPPHADGVQRICIRIGNSPVRHSAASIQRFKALWAGSGRYASADPNVAGGDAQTTILWPSRTNPEQTYAVNYGWQPDQAGNQAYYVQIDPTVLKTLAAGDEIHASIDPAAGKISQFLISAGTKQLPRVGAPPAEGVTPLATGQQPGSLPAASSSRSRFTTSDTGTSPAPASSGFGTSSRTRPRDSATLPATSPPLIAPQDDGGYASRFNPEPSPAASDLRAPAYDQPAPAYGGATGGLVDSQSGSRFNDSRLSDARQSDPRGALQPPLDYPPAAPPQSTFVQPVGAQQPQYTSPPPYQPQQPYSPAPAYQPQPTTSYSPPANDRLASAPPPLTTTTSPPRLDSPPTALPASTGNAASGPTPMLWLVVIFALFLSIGGNAYLGWTAAEFYHRYRTAVDRLRSAARS